MRLLVYHGHEVLARRSSGHLRDAAADADACVVVLAVVRFSTALSHVTFLVPAMTVVVVLVSLVL